MSSTTMRAARIVAPGTIAIERVPIPVPRAHEVRLRVEGCGVCASNLGPWQGLPYLQYPMGPGAAGHEAWGTVDAVGEAVEGIAVGARVTALCAAAYAELDVADAATVVPIPESLASTPFPGEPFACAMNVARRADLRAGQVVAVVGVGFLGAITVKLAHDAGARVVAISRRPYALEVARRMGAHLCLPLDDHGAIVERVRAFTDGRMCERVVEAVGKQWPLDLAGDLVGEHGRLVIAGYHQDGPRQVNLQAWNWKGIDVVNAHERKPEAYVRGMWEALGAVEGGAIDPAALLTHAFPLEALDRALDATAARPDGFLKAVVHP